MTKLEPQKLITKKTIKSKTSDNIYTVWVFDNCVACTCPAGGKRQLCKHIIEIVHENLEQIKEVLKIKITLGNYFLIRSKLWKDANGLI